MPGYIKLHRQLLEHPLWGREPFTWGQAWIDLLLLARFEAGNIFIKKRELALERGQLAWSETALALKWKWSRKRVANFLDYLKKEQQIELQKSNITTLITIINYDKYQLEEPQPEPQRNRKSTAEEPQKNTNKERKEGKERKENRLPVRGRPSVQTSVTAGNIPPKEEEVNAYFTERDHPQLAPAFLDHYSANGWKVGRNPMKDWRAAVRNWIARQQDFPGKPVSIHHENTGKPRLDFTL